MKFEEICKVLEGIAPTELAEEWDNSGIQIEIPNKDIKRILVALEVTNYVIDQARALNIDLIVTHHPLFFGSFKKIVPDILPTGYSIKLISNGISVYSAHTNFDIAAGGNNDYLGSLLHFDEIESYGILRKGKVNGKRVLEEGFSSSEEITIAQLGEYISAKLSIEKNKIRLIGNPNKVVKHICWCTGAGGDYMMDAFDLGADLYITGDIKYHEAMTLSEFDIDCLDIGHFGSEKIFTPNMATALRKELGNAIEVFESNMDMDPFTVL